MCVHAKIDYTACLPLYIHLHTWLHAWWLHYLSVCVSHVHVCMCAGYRLDTSLPRGFSTYFLRQILHVPKMDSWVSLASLGSQCSPGTHLSLPTPSGRVTEMFHCTQLFMWVLAGQTQVCAAGTFPTEPSSPQPQTTG